MTTQCLCRNGLGKVWSNDSKPVALHIIERNLFQFLWHLPIHWQTQKCTGYFYTAKMLSPATELTSNKRANDQRETNFPLGQSKATKSEYTADIQTVAHQTQRNIGKECTITLEAFQIFYLFLNISVYSKWRNKIYRIQNGKG